jgi:hypothetical protein
MIEVPRLVAADILTTIVHDAAARGMNDAVPGLIIATRDNLWNRNDLANALRDIVGHIGARAKPYLGELESLYRGDTTMQQIANMELGLLIDEIKAAVAKKESEASETCSTKNK